MMCVLIRIVVLATLMALCGCAGLVGDIPTVVSALGGLGGLAGAGGTVTGAQATAVILQEAQDVQNVKLGLAAIEQGPATMMLPQPVMVSPVNPPSMPPVVVTPLPPPTTSPSTGPIVTPSQLTPPHALRRRIGWHHHPAELYHLTAFTPSLEPSFCFAADLTVHPAGEC